MGIEVKYRKNKKSISIYSKSKILSSDFRKWFLSQLLEEYDLYEYLNDGIRKLDINIIEDSTRFSESEIAEYKRGYVFDVTDGYFNIDEYIDICKVVFSDIYVFSKDACVDRTNFKNGRIAIIEMEPDGDVNSIWIETFQQDFEIGLIYLIGKYNSTQG